ncbi:MAG: UDP-2,3-diacylglucosamine diphosphatase [Proteobacteria bacterium]|nr:UDP-2,3-diacylglucosamine diphosphatase [Pseudomonadota bacterium]
MATPAPSLFVSDLHLSPARPGPLAAFDQFARGPARAAAAVYVLGDLFDWWIGDEQLRDDYAARVATALHSISASGVPLFVARGNRDFLLGERFARATGAVLLPEQKVVDVAGTPTLVTHGDELATGDVDYQAYRRKIQSPASVRRLLAMPVAVRRGIAWYLRRKSTRATSLKPEAITDVAGSAVENAFRVHNVARMIHGHTHRPARHHLAVDGRPRERIVLADWHDRGHVLEVGRDASRTYDIDP